MLSTVDLLVLTRLDSCFVLILFAFLRKQGIVLLCYKTSYPKEEVNRTVLSPSVGIPWMRVRLTGFGSQGKPGTFTLSGTSTHWIDLV
jgi:hypothetical protein